MFVSLGEITLRDFKVAIDREGSYRYHFKAQDPEFGTVKEEVCLFVCLFFKPECDHVYNVEVLTRLSSLRNIGNMNI